MTRKTTMPDIPWVVLALLASCATQGPTTSATMPPEPVEAAVAEGGPRFLGLPITGPADAVRAVQTDLSFEGDPSNPDALVARGPLHFEGTTLRGHLVFYEGQLASIAGDGPEVDLARFETIARGLSHDLGAAQRMQCGSDGGPPFEEYLTSGRGSLAYEWRGEEIYARFALSPLTTGQHYVSAHLSWLPLTLRHQPDDFKGGRSKQARSACPEAAAQPASFAGFHFGASPETSAAALGPDAETRHGEVTARRSLGEVDAEIVLTHYEGCLASIWFRAEGTEASYRSMVRAVAAELGEPDIAERCSPDGSVPTAEQLAASEGSMQALWTETGPIRVAVTLYARGQAGVQVHVEAQYTPLRSRAPQIDFGG